MYVRSGSGFVLQQELGRDDPAGGDSYATSVALSGDTALVSARLDDNEKGLNAGSVYVFVRSGTTWTQQAKLLAGDGAMADEFGLSVDLEGDTAVVGAFTDAPVLVGRHGLSCGCRRIGGRRAGGSVPMRAAWQAWSGRGGRHDGLAAARPVQQGPIASAGPGERAAAAPRPGRGEDATGRRRAGRARRGLDRLVEGAAQVEGPAGGAAVLVDGHGAPRVGRTMPGGGPGAPGRLLRGRAGGGAVSRRRAPAPRCRPRAAGCGRRSTAGC